MAVPKCPYPVPDGREVRALLTSRHCSEAAGPYHEQRMSIPKLIPDSAGYEETGIFCCQQLSPGPASLLTSSSSQLEDKDTLKLGAGSQEIIGKEPSSTKGSSKPL